MASCAIQYSAKILGTHRTRNEYFQWVVRESWKFRYSKKHRYACCNYNHILSLVLEADEMKIVAEENFNCTRFLPLGLLSCFWTYKCNAFIHGSVQAPNGAMLWLLSGLKMYLKCYFEKIDTTELEYMSEHFCFPLFKAQAIERWKKYIIHKTKMGKHLDKIWLKQWS